LKKGWLELEANYGNGLMRTLEHRKQFKWNAMRVFDAGNHETSLLSIGYSGHETLNRIMQCSDRPALNTRQALRATSWTFAGP